MHPEQSRPERYVVLSAGAAGAATAGAAAAAAAGGDFDPGCEGEWLRRGAGGGGKATRSLFFFRSIHYSAKQSKTEHKTV